VIPRPPVRTPHPQLLLWLFLSFSHLFCAQAQPSTPVSTDLLHLANGARVNCRILAVNDSTISIEYRAPTGSGLLKRDVPWIDVSHVEFAMDDDFQSLLKNRHSLAIADTPKLADQWQKHAPLLPYRNHPIGELGLLYVETLLQNPDPAQQAQALPIITTLITNDWNPSRRQQARLLQLQALAIGERPEETRATAKTYLANADLDPAHAAEIHLILAKLAHKELHQLETDNPRWQDDDLVRPTRDDLFHMLIDHCITPSLFYGTHETPAAEGIALAMQIFIEHHDLPSAAALARELLHLYPGLPQATRATAFLTAHKLPVSPPANREDETLAVSATNPTETAEPVITRRQRYERPPPAKATPPP
jgi:hypothetical protein